MDLAKFFRRKRIITRVINDYFQLNYSEVAVILIDMQYGFIATLRNGEEDRIVPNQISVLRFCKEKNIPVIILDYFGHDETIKKLANEVKDFENVKIIIKNRDNGFTDTELNFHLKSLGAKKLFLMGINADCCVKKTAKGAIQNGYEIITSNDVIAGMSYHSDDNSISWYRDNGICVDDIFHFVGAT